MPEYLIYFNQQWVGDHPEEWFLGRVEPSMAVVDEMKRPASGCSAAGWRRTARSTPRDATSGEIVITDGPYVETKEWLGGFCVVSVPDDEAAKYVGRQGRRRLRLAAGGTPLRGNPWMRHVGAAP